MKAALQFFCLLTVSFYTVNPCRAAETNPPPRLTMELRDGSRVVGTSVEDNFKLHSALLGDLKLDVKDIRSIQCVSTNVAKLTTASGDALTVSFAESEFAFNTSFGRVELRVDSIRKIAVARNLADDRRLPGLVALWSGEGDAGDSVGLNNGKLEGKIGFAPGQIGQGFSFADADADVKIPYSPALDVGAGSGFTLTVWINPSVIFGHHPLFEWNAGDGTAYWGVHFFLDSESFSAGPGALYANIVDSNGNWHQIHTPAGAVKADAFQHVALTYDKASGAANIYCNGVLVAQQFLGRFTPKTSDNLYLGRRPLTQGEAYTFTGVLDEAAIYDRALSPAEIQSQCLEQNGGEMPPPPLISAPGVMLFNNGIFRQSGGLP